MQSPEESPKTSSPSEQAKPFLDASSEQQGHTRNVEKVCPEAKAGFFSLITYWWINSILRLGSQRPLLLDDLYQMSPTYEADHLATDFLEQWKYQASLAAAPTSSPSRYKYLLRAIYNSFGKRWTLAGLIKLVSDCLLYTSPSPRD